MSGLRRRETIYGAKGCLEAQATGLGRVSREIDDFC
jgi:hypothetical protein